jgi:hypothetical protein
MAFVDVRYVIGLSVAFVLAIFYFWCTYRHIREPEGGREENSGIQEVQRYIRENRQASELEKQNH